MLVKSSVLLNPKIQTVISRKSWKIFVCRGSGISTGDFSRIYTTGRVWRLDELCQGFKPRFETVLWLGPVRTACEYFPAL